MLKMNQVKQNDTVNGKYHGQSFAGTVAMIRRHTVCHSGFVVSVDLNEPITVYKEERNDVMLTVDKHGNSQFAWFN